MADGETHAFDPSLTDASQKERHLYEELEAIEKKERKEYRTHIKQLDSQLFNQQNVSTQRSVSAHASADLEKIVESQIKENAEKLNSYSTVESIFTKIANEKKAVTDELLQNGSDPEVIYQKTYSGNKLRKEIQKAIIELRSRLQKDQTTFLNQTTKQKEILTTEEKQTRLKKDNLLENEEEDSYREEIFEDEPDDLSSPQAPRKYALNELGRVVVPKKEAPNWELEPQENRSVRDVAKEKAMRMFESLDMIHPTDTLGRPIPQKKEAPNWELEPQENTATRSFESSPSNGPTLQELQQQEYEKIKQELESRLSSERGAQMEIEATQLPSGLLSTEKVDREFQKVLFENRQKIEQYRGTASVRIRENQILYHQIEDLLQLIAQNIHNQEDEYRTQLQDLQERVASSNAFVLQKQQEEARAEDLEKRSGIPHFEKNTPAQNKTDIDARQKANADTKENELNEQKNAIEDRNIQLIQQVTEEEILKQQLPGEILAEEQEREDEAQQDTLQSLQKILQREGLDPKEFMQDTKGGDTLSKFKAILADSKKVSYSLPVFTLGIALAVDIIEWANAPLEAAGVGFAVLFILSVIKWCVFIPIIFISTFGDAGLIEKRIVKKYILKRYQKQILSLLVELIPVIGSFWPGTFLFVLFVVNAKTQAGQLLLKLAKPIKTNIPG